jgi:hypothetical protein
LSDKGFGAIFLRKASKNTGFCLENSDFGPILPDFSWFSRYQLVDIGVFFGKNILYMDWYFKIVQKGTKNTGFRLKI